MLQYVVLNSNRVSKRAGIKEMIIRVQNLFHCIHKLRTIGHVFNDGRDLSD